MSIRCPTVLLPCANTAAAISPISSTAITCCGASTSTNDVMRPNFRLGSCIGVSMFSIKATGAMIVNGRPDLERIFSTSYLLSKWGMPVCLSALATDDITKRATPACCAAFTTFVPWRTSLIVSECDTIVSTTSAPAG